MEILEYEKMVELAKKFYKELKVEIPKEKISEAVASLTMPQYAEQYKNKYHKEIQDHRGLATLGDASCAAIHLKNYYSLDKTDEAMNKLKKKLENKEFNVIGKELLEGKLFSANNDLDDQNTKSYATAFEAVIGFVYLVDEQKSQELIKKHIVYEI